MSVEFGITSNVKFLKVEKAKEFETFRNLPKFTHVPMAVIHPSPRKKNRHEKSPTPNLTLSGNTAKLLVKRYEPKQFPDHLMRAPMDSSYSGGGGYSSSPKRARSTGGFGSSPNGSKKSLKQVRNAKENAKKMESETKRSKRAEDNKKVLFGEIKKILDSKSDDEQILPPFISSLVRDARNAVKDKRIYRYLYA